MTQIYLVEKLVLRVIEWCSEHQDYVLLFASDHGGQSFNGVDNIINHGENVEGNEAILFGWTKDIADNYENLIKIKDMSNMFNDCINLLSINLSLLLTTKLTNVNNILKQIKVKILFISQSHIC